MERYRKDLKKVARRLRTGMTEAELHLWQRLRGRQIADVPFYRQKPLLDYIVDFYCPKAKLVIEVDGSQHLEPAQRVKDATRDGALHAEGLQVLRFDDRQVLLETDAVLDVIYRAVLERLGKQ